MAYRGGDLDLRTPRTWSASQSETGMSPEPQLAPSRNRGTYAPGPIWVDEVVLACVNHAYDVALAHRSAEVRLEHLLHALTRIDAAAEALEARGIRVASLRRESATVIASELPVGLTNGNATPRHSEELEHVLRAASLIASRRNVAAGVDDVLHLILEVEPDLPGLSLLARINPRAMSPVEPAYAPRPSAGYYVEASTREGPMHAQPALSRPPRQDIRGSAVDSIQNSRLDTLEQMVRALSSDLGKERSAFTGLLQELQREVSGQREETLRMSDGLSDNLRTMLTSRLAGLEQSVAALRHAPQDTLEPVTDRIAAIERTLSASLEQFATSLSTLENDLRQRAAPAVDLQPVTNRLDIIEEAVLSRDGERLAKELSLRLDRLEDMLAVERKHTAEAGAALRGEMGLMAQAVEKQGADLAASFLDPLQSRLADQDERARLALAGIDERLADAARKFGEAETASHEELSEIKEALVKINANQHTLAGALEKWRTEAQQMTETLRGDLRQGSEALTADVRALAPRFSALETESNKLTGLVDGLSGMVDKMHRVTVERYHRRNRFRFWLFGTDDWVAASWPSQTQRIADELKLVKTGYASGRR